MSLVAAVSVTALAAVAEGGIASCRQPPEHCTERQLENASTSDRSFFLVADDFTPAVDGAVESICWWGVYLGEGNCPASDTFRVRYFRDDGGLPGTLIAEFQQANGTLDVAVPIKTGELVAGNFPEYVFSATHLPVPVQAGECWWIEISNAPGACTWFWEQATGGNDRCAQDGPLLDGYDVNDVEAFDLAFCLDVALDDASVCLPICHQPAENCNEPSLVDALLSDRTNFVAADDFSPASDGEVNSICWWGTYTGSDAPCPDADTFRVRYYNDENGLPGAILAEFRQSTGTLDVAAPTATGEFVASVFPEYEHTASHLSLPVQAGQCYWVEISSDPDAQCAWFWELGTGGDGRSLQDGGPLDGYDEGDEATSDLAFCLSVALADVASCDCPWDLDGNGEVGFEDVIILLQLWGTDPGGPPDFDGNGEVDFGDVLELLSNWGVCG